MLTIDLSGKMFGRLTIGDRVGTKYNGQALWEAKCRCGEITTTTWQRLKTGAHQSCGCLGRELASKRYANLAFRHGHAKVVSPTYRTWLGMRNRCRNPRSGQYAYYGGRGIAVCDRWNVFENFLSDMGERPAGRSIDRIDVNGNYEPSNCRWATASEQRRNQRPRTRRAI